MKCGARSLSAIVLLVTLSSSQLLAQSKSAPPNMAGIELLGRGLAYSFNYERLLTYRIGVGGGLA